MAHIANIVYYANVARRALRRERIFRDRINPLDSYDDIDFQKRYRLSRQTTLHVIDILQDDIAPAFGNRSIPSQLQVLIALRFYATG